MPGAIDGVGLAREIRSKYPDVPVLLTTGYSAAAQEAPPDLRCLRKPFDAAALRGFIQDMMGESSASEAAPAAEPKPAAKKSDRRTDRRTSRSRLVDAMASGLRRNVGNWPRTEMPQRVRLVCYREKRTQRGHRRGEAFDPGRKSRGG